MRRLVLVFAAFFGLAADAQAQRQPIPVGARVKLVVFERERQAETRLTRRLVVRGELTAQSSESIWVRPTPLTGVLSVHRSDVRRIFESRGPPSRVKSFFIDGAGGAIVGAIDCAIFYDVEALGRPRCGADSRGDAALRGAAFGFVALSLLGAAFPVEYWRLRSINR